MIIINGQEIKKCGFCEKWYSGTVCECLIKNKLNGILDSHRRINTSIIFIMPFQDKILNTKCSEKYFD